LNAITNISESYVISFNYTHTPYKLFRIPIENTHYIHGEIDLNRSKSEINTMVFGIEDKGNDVNFDLIPETSNYSLPTIDKNISTQNITELDYTAELLSYKKNAQNFLIFYSLDENKIPTCSCKTRKSVGAARVSAY